MRTITQAEYNSDALQMEVIEEIAEQLRGGAILWTPDHEALLEHDRALFIFIRDNPDATFDGRQTDWELAEDDWRRKGEQHNVHVYDDGEAGITIVGTADEVAAWSSLS